MDKYGAQTGDPTGAGLWHDACHRHGAPQCRKIEDLGAGRLLVMERQQPDPVIAESVILLIHYGTDGVVGLRLNQPSRLPLSRLREVKGTADRLDPAYVRG